MIVRVHHLHTFCYAILGSAHASHEQRGALAGPGSGTRNCKRRSKSDAKMAARMLEIVIVILTLSAVLGVFHIGSKVSKRNVARSSPLTEENPTPEIQNVTTLDRQQSKREAYVTMLYGDFVLGLRVLGQSLRESGTTRDFIALCMDDVPEHVRRVLRREGWKIRNAKALPEECLGKDNNLDTLFFTKLLAWTLIQYNRIVYIDADAIVLHNIDQMFRCARFCATYRHSDLFNAGVLVLKPSLEIFSDMCSEITKCGTYDKGDQGFFNCYYDRLKYAPMLGENESYSDAPLMRLPAQYNADVGAYYLNNRWLFRDVKEPMILHYTLGPVKPWKWWTYPLFSLNWRWNSLRERLPPAAELLEPSPWDWPNLAPTVVFVILYLTSKVWGRWYSQVIEHPRAVDFMMRIIPGRVSSFFPTITLTMSLLLAFFCIPPTMYPMEAWGLYLLWIAYFNIFFYSIFCQLTFVIGKQGNSTKYVAATEVSNITLKSGASIVGFVVIFFLMVVVPTVLQKILCRLVCALLFILAEYTLVHFAGCWFISQWYVYGLNHTSK